ncbi:hypothetical protein [Desulfolucanica intricata]|uniref:hypothetical protein n=1 Tax=Desulfolucanica intricata TaxID=1285191 RepID=UPI000A56EAA6|nr:hypothetical protein [Desulfolucanica intricata]
MANPKTLPKITVLPKIRVVANCITEESDKVLRRNCYKIIAKWIKKELAVKKEGHN